VSGCCSRDLPKVIVGMYENIISLRQQLLKSALRREERGD